METNRTSDCPHRTDDNKCRRVAGPQDFAGCTIGLEECVYDLLTSIVPDKAVSKQVEIAAKEYAKKALVASYWPKCDLMSCHVLQGKSHWIQADIGVRCRKRYQAYRDGFIAGVHFFNQRPSLEAIFRDTCPSFDDGRCICMRINGSSDSRCDFSCEHGKKFISKCKS